MHTLKTESKQHGFTLIEVMITLVIMSIGLLGVAQLQLTALRFNRDAHHFSQAISAAEDIALRMTANNGDPATLVAYHNNTSTLATLNLAELACFVAPGGIATGCTAAEMVNYDVASWRDMIESTVQGGTGRICHDSDDVGCDTDGGLRYRIDIGWTETDGATRTYTLEVYP